MSSRGPVKTDDLESLSCWEGADQGELADAGEQQTTEKVGRRCPLIRDAGGCSTFEDLSCLVLPALPMEQEVRLLGESCRVG